MTVDKSDTWTNVYSTDSERPVVADCLLLTVSSTSTSLLKVLQALLSPQETNSDGCLVLKWLASIINQTPSSRQRLS